MVNRYDTPAQAQFIDTYVPIPFEQLYTMGVRAKEDVDKAMKELGSTLDKWDEFKSPSLKDMQTWDRETRQKIAPIVNEMAGNLDSIKSAEGRAKLYSTLNNLDRGTLNLLKQSAEGLTQRQKVNQQLMLSGKYNPLWHDVDFSNWDSTSAGVYNDISPLAYQSVKDLTDKYVNNLDPSYLGRSGGFIHTGVTKEQIAGILDANKSGILSTPEAKMHMQMYMKSNPKMTPQEAANMFMEQALIDNMEHTKHNVTADPFAMEDLRYKRALDVANARKKGKGEKEEGAAYPDAYNKMYSSAAENEQRQILTNPMFAKTREIVGSRLQAQNELANVYLPALQEGKITVDQYNRAVKDYQDYQNALTQNDSAKKAYQSDLRTKFSEISHISPEKGVLEKNLPDYYDASSRLLNTITKPESGAVLGKYASIVNSGEYEINSGDTVTKGYQSPDSRGLMLSTTAVNKIMGVFPEATNYRVKDVNDNYRNFATDLESGVFTNVLKQPRNQVMTMELNGRPTLVQRVTVKIPKQSIKNARYDTDEFEDMVEKAFGITGENGISVKPIKEENITDAWGTAKNRAGAAMTDTYYSFDVVEPLDPNGMSRLTLDQEINKQHGGSKLQNEEFDSSFNDSYEYLMNSQY